MAAWKPPFFLNLLSSLTSLSLLMSVCTDSGRLAAFALFIEGQINLIMLD